VLTSNDMIAGSEFFSKISCIKFFINVDDHEHDDPDDQLAIKNEDSEALR